MKLFAAFVLLITFSSCQNPTVKKKFFKMDTVLGEWKNPNVKGVKGLIVDTALRYHAIDNVEDNNGKYHWIDTVYYAIHITKNILTVKGDTASVFEWVNPNSYSIKFLRVYLPSTDLPFQQP